MGLEAGAAPGGPDAPLGPVGGPHIARVPGGLLRGGAGLVCELAALRVVAEVVEHHQVQVLAGSRTAAGHRAEYEHCRGVQDPVDALGCCVGVDDSRRLVVVGRHSARVRRLEADQTLV